MNWIQLLSDRRAGEEKKKNTDQRSKFEQDYDRIIFSHPFRMLQDKTQVFPLPKQDFVHTRLDAQPGGGKRWTIAGKTGR
jgi:dGTPase